MAASAGNGASEASEALQPVNSKADAARLRSAALRTPERQRLYEAICQHPGWTREALAEVTELSRHAVGGLLALLLFSHLIRVDRTGEPRYWAIHEGGDDAEGSGPGDV